MLDLKQIVCPIDFSEASLRALDRAVAMAAWYGARVTALHVYASWPVMEDVPALRSHGLETLSVDETVRKEVLAAMRAFVDRRTQKDVPVELVLREAPNVPKAILAMAAEAHADVLVVGSHGRSGFNRALLGSVTEKLLRVSPCPVLVVPVHDQVRAISVAKPKSIVCPVDFSGASEAALRYALALAEESDAHLTVLHAIEVPPELREAPVANEFDVDRVRAAAEAEALRRLRELIPETARTYCTIETAVAEGRASREILRRAAADNADLIVMGLVGRSAIDRWLFGSNTQHVAREATCPVLVLRGASTEAKGR